MSCWCEILVIFNMLHCIPVNQVFMDRLQFTLLCGYADGRAGELNGGQAHMQAGKPAGMQVRG